MYKNKYVLNQTQTFCEVKTIIIRIRREKINSLYNNRSKFVLL